MQPSARTLAAGARWRAWVARLLSVAVLLAALLVPPFADHGAAAAALSVSAAKMPDTNGAPSAHPSSGIHAGAHCTCQLAVRIEAQDQPGPAATGTVVHLVCTNLPLASCVADPPTRPPQA